MVTLWILKRLPAVRKVTCFVPYKVGANMQLPYKARFEASNSTEDGAN